MEPLHSRGYTRLPLASRNTRVSPSTTTVKPSWMVAFTAAALGFWSGAPTVGGVVRSPARVAVLVELFQSTFLPIISPMARRGR